MSEHYFSEPTRRFAMALPAVVLLAIIIALGVGVPRVAESDRKAREARYAACLTIEAEPVRALCVNGGK